MATGIQECQYVSKCVKRCQDVSRDVLTTVFEVSTGIQECQEVSKGIKKF